MIFANIKSITIPEGKVKQIKSSTTLIWEKMEEETIEIINLLPKATNTDRITIYGGDYNGDGVNDGYKTKTRLSSSSGGATTADGMCASGFIPCVAGDIIRIKGTKPKYGTASYVMTFDSSNKKIVAMSMTQQGTDPIWMNSTSSAEWFQYDTENDIITITLLSSVFGTGFDSMRFSAGVITGDTIVTKNQKIV